MSKKIGHGYIDLRFGRGFISRKVRIYGGPIEIAPPDIHRLNLRDEAADLPADQLLPIKDFQVPDEDACYEALYEFLGKAIEDGRAFTGCWGGTGRTGIILALAAKVAGFPAPITFVRAQYKPGAVENQSQEVFITRFPTDEIALRMNKRGFRRALQFWRR